MAAGLKGRALVFGAGSIGRGFLGQLISQSGYETVFIDVDEVVVDSLNRLGRYPVHIAAEPQYDVMVENVSAIHASSEEQLHSEVASADFCATAVGKKALPTVTRVIAEGIEIRRTGSGLPLNILICENIPQPGKTVTDLISRNLSDDGKRFLSEKVGIVEAVISRMVPLMPDGMREKDPLFVSGEAYAALPVDGKAFAGKVPEIQGLELCDDIRAYVERKLHAHNMSHAVCGYLGYLRGYTYVWEAIRDEGVKEIVRGALRETGSALIKKHGFDKQVQENHEEDLLRRFDNKPLEDPVVRAGRDPLRKLAGNDRLVGSAAFALEQGITPENIAMGIAAGIVFDDPGDDEAVRLSQMLKKDGLEGVLKDVCSIYPESVIGKLVQMKMKVIKEKWIS